MGCLVAIKQAYPQGGFPLVARLKMEVKVFTNCANIPQVDGFKDFPVLILLLLGGLAILHVISFAPFFLAFFGFLSSWTFLRHFQHRDGLRGDPSDAFAFEEFFPAPLQYEVDPLLARSRFPQPDPENARQQAVHHICFAPVLSNKISHF